MQKLTNIYIIQDARGYIKIGRSDNVSRRLKQLQTAHSHPLKLIYLCSAPSYLEKRLHSMFFLYKKQGEWFDCSPSLLKTIIEYLSERYMFTDYQLTK